MVFDESDINSQCISVENQLRAKVGFSSDVETARLSAPKPVPAQNLGYAGLNELDVGLEQTVPHKKRGHPAPFLNSNTTVVIL